MEDALSHMTWLVKLNAIKVNGLCKHSPSSRLGERIGGLERTGLAKT